MIGKMIRYYRELMDVTQQELADKIFVSPATIGHYETETRTPGIDKLELIAGTLGIKIEQLLEKNECYFKELEFIENELDLTIMKESLNILAIKKLIEKLLEDDKNNRLIIIVDEFSTLTDKIMMEYFSLRKYIYFYRPNLWSEGKPFDIDRMMKIKDHLSSRDFGENDNAMCVFNADPRYDISVGCKHTVVSEDYNEEYGFETLEVVTLSGNWGYYPKDWFELEEKGDSNAEVPRNRFLDILKRFNQ
jgi:transcriptional regulator with XRE-family HTH domain